MKRSSVDHMNPASVLMDGATIAGAADRTPPSSRESFPRLPYMMRTLRRRSGRTQRDVARRVGVTQQAVSIWESGDKTPSARFVDSLCLAVLATRSEREALRRAADADRRDRADRKSSMSSRTTGATARGRVDDRYSVLTEGELRDLLESKRKYARYRARLRSARRSLVKSGRMEAYFDGKAGRRGYRFLPGAPRDGYMGFPPEALESRPGRLPYGSVSGVARILSGRARNA